MNNIILGFVLVTFLLFTLSADLWLRHLVNKRQMELLMVLDTGKLHKQERYYLLIDYASEHFKRIDEALSLPTMQSITIVLTAPEWFVAMKRKKWTQHKIYHADSEPAAKPFKNMNLLIWINRNGRIIRIEEITAFLEHYISHSRAKEFYRCNSKSLDKSL